MKKYEFTEDIKMYGYRTLCHTLHRIRAVRDFGKVKAGDLGGWIESEDNLSHEGNCWVYDDAEVKKNAKVWGNAEVSGEVLVLGHAQVGGNAKVCDYAVVRGNAKVWGNAKVGDYAECFATPKYLEARKSSGLP